MNEFTDAVELFTKVINELKKGTVNLHSPLEEIVLKTGRDNLAYVDNRRDAKEKYEYDFWGNLDKSWLKSREIPKRVLYSKSEQFPDFLFKVRKCEETLTSGSLLELKNSKGASIASFNSTLPTRHKSLEEIDVINGNNLVSNIASVMDREYTHVKGYRTCQRRCFYLVRTHANDDKVKLSVVDGSFFETVPKESLIYQMFLNVLRGHLEKKEIKVSPEVLKQVEEVLSHVTDQTIIAASQIIERASVRPRLRIMAEVHPEGNPHSGFYRVPEGGFNLILEASSSVRELGGELHRKIPEIKVFSIHHKRNGEHIVFQFRPESKLQLRLQGMV